jgi:hypothetical protein
MTTAASDKLEALRRAIHELNAAPTPENVRRYLAASRLLALDTRRAPKVSSRGTPRA